MFVTVHLLYTELQFIEIPFNGGGAQMELEGGNGRG